MRIVFILLTNYTMTTKAILGGVLLLPILMGSTFAAKTELQSAQSLAAQWVINSGKRDDESYSESLWEISSWYL